MVKNTSFQYCCDYCRFYWKYAQIGKQYDRSVQVKGLSEREVDADLAVWPINISLAANDLNILSGDIERQNKEVYDFLLPKVLLKKN